MLPLPQTRMNSSMELEQLVSHTEHNLHNNVDPHRRSTSGLSDIILGGQDGLVNVLGVILGVAAQDGDLQAEARRRA